MLSLLIRFFLSLITLSAVAGRSAGLKFIWLLDRQFVRLTTLEDLKRSPNCND